MNCIYGDLPIIKSIILTLNVYLSIYIYRQTKHT